MNQTVAKRVMNKMGLDRKGTAFLLMGLTWITLGLGVLNERHVGLWHEWLPDQIRTFAWVFAGVLSIVGAWKYHCRPWAAFFLVIGPGIRMVSYFSAWVIYLLPDGDAGNSWGWLNALTYLLMIAFVFYVASDDAHVETMNEISAALRVDPKTEEGDDAAA